MNTDKIIELAFYTLPALITGGVAYYLFNSYFADQQNTRRWLVQKENQKLSLPIRLQAFERLALYLERINPAKLLLRIAPMSDNKTEYENLLIQHIEQEFEHNLSQQIYVSDNAWTIILTAKNTTIQLIRKSAKNETISTSHQLREGILSDLVNVDAPSNMALSFLKSEVSEIL
jgi:hypothetical protein